ncbi:hypothetical protein CASFOL_001174 [Castilleja foliolosa]|uniref:NB-ARC domain-containing protein n=1 Tax=Castilleja foliolosa TaxID=1961234 RepID=A0ABD3ELT7_9LAMI
MASYAASVSVDQTILRLLNSSDNISIDPRSQESLYVAHASAQSLQKLLKHLDGSSFIPGGNGLLQLQDLLESHSSSNQLLSQLDTFSRGRGQKTNAQLDEKIRNAACQFEDALENHVVNVILSQSHYDEKSSTIDLHELKQEIDSFTQRVKELEAECIQELLINTCLEEKDNENDDDVDIEIKSKMVGMYDVISQTRLYLVPRDGDESTFGIVSLVGMAGIGKTTLAKELYLDQSIMSRFDYRAFVNIGQSYQLIKILQRILDQVHPDSDRVLTLDQEGDDDVNDDEEYLLARQFYRCLEFGTYLIVLDDVWDTQIVQYLQGSFPYGCDGYLKNCKVLILVTTRLESVGSWAGNRMLKLRFLDKEESWDLLRDKVFDGESYCQLEKPGKKIAENCDGLPLAIVTVAGFLSKAEKTLECWNELAEKKNSIYTDAYDRMSNVLFPSYDYLPQDLKTCFLYMVVFPQNYEIRVDKLSMLWNAEGYLEPNPIRFLKDVALDYLDELVRNSLVLAHEWARNKKLKTCGLHSGFWHLCMREAGKNGFLRVLNTYDDAVAVDMKNQRRLCIHNNVLFAIKGVTKSMASSSAARSLLCTGPHHRYPVPICFGHFRLLRVIDALTVRFYEFPVQILKLVQLRYLALVYDGKIPVSISKLRNLEILIIRRYLSIVEPNEMSSSYLPMEIWDMKELKHLEITGSNLPDPCHGVVLPNLETILGTSAQSCTKSVLGGLPSLVKLGIRVELTPDFSEPFSCFDHVSRLGQLRSLKCVVMNPVLGSTIVTLPTSSSFFPVRLKKLSLSGVGYPWENMSIISLLPNLRSLKLRCYAFRGAKWETNDKEFRLLEFLHIEDTDLEHWIVRYGSFKWLKRLCLKHCYKLKTIPYVFRDYVSEIDVEDCNSLKGTRGRRRLADEI